MIIPDGHNQDHTAIGEGRTHLLETALGGKGVGITEGSLLGGTEAVGDRISRDTGNVGLTVRDDFAVLDVEATDFRERASVCTVIGDELCDNSELALSVNSHARSKEGLISHAVTVKVAAGLVTGRGTCATRAGKEAFSAARVGSVGLSEGICFPNVHFLTASPSVASTSILICGGSRPTIAVGLRNESTLS